MHMGVVGGPIKEFRLKCHFVNAMLTLCLLHSFMVDNGVKKDNCVMQRDALLTSHWVMQQKASSAVLGPYF